MGRHSCSRYYIMLRHSDGLLINVYNGTKRCPSVLQPVVIRVPPRNISNVPRPVVPPVSARQLDVLLPLMQFVNRHIFLET